MADVNGRMLQQDVQKVHPARLQRLKKAEVKVEQKAVFTLA
jgi:hypothetical protein